jgi:hypothetical protein
VLLGAPYRHEAGGTEGPNQREQRVVQIPSACYKGHLRFEANDELEATPAGQHVDRRLREWHDLAEVTLERYLRGVPLLVPGFQARLDAQFDGVGDGRPIGAEVHDQKGRTAISMSPCL